MLELNYFLHNYFFATYYYFCVKAVK